GGDFRERTDYTGSAKEDTSWAFVNGQWRWTAEVTPGKANVGSVDQRPVASFTIEKPERYYIGGSITFDGSASSDIESRKLSYLWDFGDDATDDEQKTTHAYDGDGEYEIVLSVTDEAGQVTSVSHSIHIETPVEQMTLGGIAPITFDKDALLITEALPNPDGSDASEWIELKNDSDSDIKLIGWRLDDNEGGSTPYVFPETAVVPAHSYLVVEREVSKLSLNNDSDSIRLLTPLGQEWQTVGYEKAPSGHSYAYDEVSQEWLWLATLTPGAQAAFDDVENPYVLGASYDSSVIEDVALVNEEMRGSLVAIRGLVVVPPHAIGSQKLYIASAGDAAASQATLEIYQYRGDFPELTRGDRIEVTGEVSIVQGRPRVKISNAHDIVFLEHSQLEIPEQVSIIDISEEFDRSLVTVQGTVDRVNKKSFSLSEGDERVAVYLGDGVAMDDLRLVKDSQVSVTGFLQYQSGTPRLRLIDPGDVRIAETSDISARIADQVQEQVEKPEVAAESPLRPWLYVATLPITASIGWIIKKFFLTKFK
ncbi:MAG: PKD domain-containing protein, partial [Patescibacteria group bacterium]